MLKYWQFRHMFYVIWSDSLSAADWEDYSNSRDEIWNNNLNID